MRRYMREFLDVMYPEKPGNKVAQEPAIIDATRLIRRLRSLVSAIQYRMEVEVTAHDACQEKLAYYRDTLCISGGTMIKLEKGAETEVINPERLGAVLNERDRLQSHYDRYPPDFIDKLQQEIDEWKCGMRRRNDDDSDA